ncbi:MAG: hypothetical protein A2905_05450 [Candidatus Levybacteria bacterium RIFCSPLOWO2_01_FULL_36_10]|nr:MAG: hypothetical protein A2905_05450 [Candidatus Levybacteria bacterium RIFCSPLOWO2_01_FULL_36_10]
MGFPVIVFICCLFPSNACAAKCRPVELSLNMNLLLNSFFHALCVKRQSFGEILGTIPATN